MATMEDSAKRIRIPATGGPIQRVRGYLRNMALFDETGDLDKATWTFMFRPASVNERVAPSYNSMGIMGMSQQYRGYQYTENVSWDFEVYANALMMLKERRTADDKARSSINQNAKSQAQGATTSIQAQCAIMEESRRFLEAAAYPSTYSNGVIGSEPTALILSIPGILTQRVRLMSLLFTFTQCDSDGNPTEWRAQTTWEEAPLGRISMQDQLANGMFRTWGR